MCQTWVPAPKPPGFFEEWTLAFNDFENMLNLRLPGELEASSAGTQLAKE
jgi:hypothetical protein